MNSTGLADWQVEQLFKRVQQELHFLDRKDACTRSISRRTTPSTIA